MTDSHSTDEDTTSTTRSAQTGKVARLLTAYDLTEMGKELEIAWTHPDDPVSLRDLAARFNQRLLEAAMKDTGWTPLDGEVENMYRLLTADDVSPGASTEARRGLERADIDVDQLETDFVSRQAIHTYLTKVRGVTNQSSDEDPVTNARTYLRHLQQRTATITDSRLTQLRDTGHLSVNSPRVLVDVQILCEDCGQQYSLEDMFTAGSCACEAIDNP